MMITGVAEVIVRKGLSEEYYIRSWEFGYDDLPDETTWLEVERMVRADINNYYHGLIEDRPYGKFWEIGGIHSN